MWGIGIAVTLFLVGFLCFQLNIGSKEVAIRLQAISFEMIVLVALVLCVRWMIQLTRWFSTKSMKVRLAVLPGLWGTALPLLWLAFFAAQLLIAISFIPFSVFGNALDTPNEFGTLLFVAPLSILSIAIASECIIWMGLLIAWFVSKFSRQS